jgi:hypothetical protein
MLGTPTTLGAHHPFRYGSVLQARIECRQIVRRLIECAALSGNVLPSLLNVFTDTGLTEGVS